MFFRDEKNETQKLSDLLKVTIHECEPRPKFSKAMHRRGRVLAPGRLSVLSGKHLPRSLELREGTILTAVQSLHKRCSQCQGHTMGLLPFLLAG